jgi:predicted transcriptional regulator
LEKAEELMHYVSAATGLSPVNRSSIQANPSGVGPSCCLRSWQGDSVAVAQTSVVSKTTGGHRLQLEYSGAEKFAALGITGHFGNRLERGTIEEMNVRLSELMSALGLNLDGVEQRATNGTEGVTVDDETIIVPTVSIVAFVNHSGLHIAFGNEIRMTFDMHHNFASRLEIFPWFVPSNPTIDPEVARARALAFLNETVRETNGKELSESKVSLAFDSLHYGMVYHIEASYASPDFKSVSDLRVWVGPGTGEIIFWQSLSPHPGTGGRPVVLPGREVLILLIAVVAVTAFAATYSEPAAMALSLLAAFMYARLSRAGALDHFVRGQVYAFVVARPGVTFSEIRDTFSLHNGSATHHLRVLTKLGFLKALTDGPRKRFFPAEAQGRGFGRKLTGLQYRLIETVEGRGKITAREAARTLGISRQRARYNLRRLSESGLLALDGSSFRLHDGAEIQDVTEGPGR